MGGWIAIASAILPVAACAAAPTSTPTASPSPAIRLTVRVDIGVGVWKQWSLNCRPTGGTHPNRVAACKSLTAPNGRSLLDPIPPHTMCTMIYGGPERATVIGTWNGKRVSARFARTNGCEIDRWERAKALFTVPGKVVVQGNVSLSPTCAVQHIGETCEDPSVAALVTFTRGTVTVRTRAVAGKGFAVRLDPGTWQATADAGMSCPVVAVAVPITGPLVIACDTGIR